MAKIIQIIAKISGIDKIKTDLKNATDDIENNPIEIPVKIEAEGSIQELKRLKNEIKKVGAGTDEFKNLFAQIDDLEDKIKGAKQVSSDWIDTLENSGGVLGGVGKGLNSLKVQFSTLGGAIKATGVGLLVSLLALLVGAFKDNETAMKKIQPLLDGVQKIFQGLFRVVEPLFNILVDLALKALPLVTDAIGSVYSVVSAVVESFGALGRAIGKLVKGDFSGAWDEAKKSVTEFSGNFNASKDRYIAGTKEMTKHEKDEAEKRNEARQKEAERQAKLQAEREKKAKEEADRLAKIEKEKQDRIRAFAEEAQEKENKILAEIAKAKEQNALEGKTQREIELFEEQKKYDALIAQAIAFGLDISALTEQHNNTVNDINKKGDATSLKNQDDLLAELEKDADETIKADKEIADKKAQAQKEALDITKSTLSQATELFGEATVAGKASAIASTTINTYESATKAFNSLAGIPVVGTALGTVAAGVAIAAGLANVKKIIAVKTPKGGGGGSVPSGANSFSSVPTTPQINLVGNSTDFNSATATPINNQQNTFTVKAFVSETDITNSQNFISKVKSSAEI